MFENFPKIEYSFISEDGTFTNEMQDIFRRVSLTQETLNNPSNFKYYVINDGDTPERIAVDAYNDSFLWWVVLLTNNILDKNEEWPKSVSELNRLFESFLNGNSYYIMENLSIQKEDVIVKRNVASEGSVDINIYGIIDDYDLFLHKIDVKTNQSEGTFSSGDEFYIYRRANENFFKIDGFGLSACSIQNMGSTSCVELVGPTAPYCLVPAQIPCLGKNNAIPYGELCATLGSTFGIIRRVDSIKSSLSSFEFKGDSLNPYSVPNGNGATGNFFVSENQNLCGYTATLLHRYIDPDSNIPGYIDVISRGADIIRNNDNRRKIKLIKPSVVNKIIKEFNGLINNSVSPGTTKYITLAQ